MQQESQEKEFLHNIATPLGTAIFVLDLVMDEMQNRRDVRFDELKQLNQVYKSLEKVKDMLEQRRDVLVGSGVSGERE